MVANLKANWGSAAAQAGQAGFAKSLAADSLGLFDDTAGVEQLNARTELTVPDWLNPLVETCEREVHIYYRGRRLDLPLATEPVIRRILNDNKFTPDDLTELDEASRLVLAKHLVREGLARVV